MNFYAWVREGVKRAVLLGFSDAIEHIGTPHEGEESTQQLLAMLRQPKALDGPERAPAQAHPSRKRLGRSLDEIVKSPNPAPQT